MPPEGLVLEIDQLNEIADYAKLTRFRAKKRYRNTSRLAQVLGAERTTGYLVSQRKLKLPKK